MANSTRVKKPAKPHADFPLFPHASGRWAKKVRGRFAYFGKVAVDPKGEAALRLWLDQRDDLLAGRTPRAGRDGLTVKALCDRFCSVKQDAADAGEIKRRTFTAYVAVARMVADAFGRGRLVEDLASDDFEALRRDIANRYGLVGLANEITYVRGIFKYAFDAGLIDRPVRFGPTFKRPAKRILRAERQRQGSRLFEARHLRRLIKGADQPLRAMLLLAANAGYGNADVGSLPFSALDLTRGWCTFPRPKTSIERRCPLWPETVEALKEAISRRREPKDPAHAELVFITKHGGPWAKDSPNSPVSGETRRLLDKLGLYRRGLSFYSLRHCFETVASDCRDEVAVNTIMGHADASMAANYRHHVDDARLEDCVAVVRRWLFRRASSRPWRGGAGKAAPRV